MITFHSFILASNLATSFSPWKDRLPSIATYSSYVNLHMVCRSRSLATARHQSHVKVKVCTARDIGAGPTISVPAGCVNHSWFRTGFTDISGMMMRDHDVAHRLRAHPKSDEMWRVARSPKDICTTPSSHPLITCPWFNRTSSTALFTVVRTYHSNRELKELSSIT